MGGGSGRGGDRGLGARAGWRRRGDRRRGCCGSAGVYALTQPDQADALLQRKVAHIASTGAAVLTAANPGCQLQIARGLRDAGLPVRVLHPVTLLARAYRRETPGDLTNAAKGGPS